MILAQTYLVHQSRKKILATFENQDCSTFGSRWRLISAAPLAAYRYRGMNIKASQQHDTKWSTYHQSIFFVWMAFGNLIELILKQRSECHTQITLLRVSTNQSTNQPINRYSRLQVQLQLLPESQPYIGILTQRVANSKQLFGHTAKCSCTISCAEK
jgi:hypothetical protein